MIDDFLPDISGDQIVELADDFIKTASNAHSAMDAVVELLKASMPYYDWVGIYSLENDDVLKLGPFRGEPSQHTEIPIGKGICGAAASKKQTIIVDDVNADPRYLACSLKTKSEIVVPIKKGEKVLGEIDIDSDKPAAFGEYDRNFLEMIAARLAEII
jgi:putative methionine-R-sulfoxide reductase with GAF domain